MLTVIILVVYQSPYLNHITHIYHKERISLRNVTQSSTWKPHKNARLKRCCHSYEEIIKLALETVLDEWSGDINLGQRWHQSLSRG